MATSMNRYTIIKIDGADWEEALMWARQTFGKPLAQEYNGLRDYNWWDSMNWYSIQHIFYFKKPEQAMMFTLRWL
jgi:hypothetical protein